MVRAISSSLRTDLVRTRVHDLRSPLTSLRSALQLFELDDVSGLTPDQRAMLAAIDRVTRQMQELVSAILDVSQLESRSLPLERISMELPAVLAEVVREHQPQAVQRGLTLQLEPAPALPAVWVDVNLLRRILQNLVGNALKFTPAGGAVRVTAVSEAQALKVTVADSGPGIPPGLQSRLFQKFVAGQVAGRGNGLGLAFCRLVVEAHGGRIWLVSPPGQGAAFSFTLPAG